VASRRTTVSTTPSASRYGLVVTSPPTARRRRDISARTVTQCSSSPNSAVLADVHDPEQLSGLQEVHHLR
jgi:hypothetical protein